MRQVARTWGLIRPDRFRITLYLSCLTVAATLTVAPPILFGRLIDSGLASGDQRVVRTLGLLTIALAVVGAVVTGLSRWLASLVAEGITFRARQLLFTHVRALPIGFTTHSDTGAVTNRILNDVAGLQSLTEAASVVLASTTTLVAVLVTMLSIDWHITLVALGMFPMFFPPSKAASAAMKRQQARRMNTASALASLTMERVSSSGALLARLFSTPSRDAETFAVQAGELRHNGVRLAVLNSAYLGGLGLMIALGTATVFWLGALALSRNAISVGELVELSALTTMLYGVLTQLAATPVNLTAATASLNRVFEVLDLPIESTGVGDLAHVKGDVGMRDVRFTYPTREHASLPSLQMAGSGEESLVAGEEVLRGLTLTINAGQTVAFVGASGAGKSTLAMLLAGVCRPTSGTIHLDGANINALSQDSLVRAVGVVTQDTFFLHDTLEANLRFAEPGADEVQLWEACHAAGIGELVAGFPHGLQTVVGDRGHRLSGGQRQRLALARVLLKRPALVILDEATAHLDSRTELEARANLARELCSSTTIVITHRLTTITGVDRIFVLQEGRIIESGRHDDLLAAQGFYAGLYAAQSAPGRDREDDLAKVSFEGRATEAESASARGVGG